MRSRDLVNEELSWRLLAERGVVTTPVVEDLDVIEQICDGLGAGGVARAVHPFVFQTVEEAIRGRIDAPMSSKPC